MLSFSILAMMPSRSTLEATEQAGERLVGGAGRRMSLSRLVQSENGGGMLSDIGSRRRLQRQTWARTFFVDEVRSS